MAPAQNAADALSEDSPLRLERQLCFPLYAAGRRAVGRYTPLLRPLGLTYTQYLVLLLLWERDGLPVGELCRKLYLDNGTLTPLLKKLEDAALVRRERSRNDERVVSVRLTERGRALRREAERIPEQVGKDLPISPEEAETLYRLLYRVIEGL